MHKRVKDAGIGIINGIILVPVVISFCSIIFKNEIFISILPSLVKLVVFSSLVHQTIFTISSSLPFAVGQVQDAGLIFLSGMTSDIVSYYQSNPSKMSFESMVATALFVISISTAALGIALMVTGRLKLASMMQYLPMPVIGGYLAYIGFYCGQAGVGMMTGVEVICDTINII